MRRLPFLLLAWALLLASCLAPFDSAQTPPQPDTESSVVPSPTKIPHAPEIRFALIGEPADVNVWSMYDEQGAGYANYALRNDYWPRLYHLAIPDFTPLPRAADGPPSPVVLEGDFFTSTITLRADLKWTDGLPFTADDVAFTVNTALAFELGFDWRAYYSPDYLVRAEALDAHTVKFHFKQQPNVGVWQYGALQGPIVQRAYWEPRIAEARAGLPDDALRASIAQARAEIAELQPIVTDLYTRFFILQQEGKSSRELDRDLKRKEGDLNKATNDLAKFLAEYASRIETGHQALYALDAQDEPTLGVWMPSENKDGLYVNSANPDFPFEKPNFDRTAYQVFALEQDAITALQDGEVDGILASRGISAEAGGNISSATIVRNETNSARFLVFSPARAELANPSLRSALNCMIDKTVLAGQVLGNQAMPLESFVLRGPWRNTDLQNPCGGMDESARLQKAVEMLKSAGYSWAQEPSAPGNGTGLLQPSGAGFPQLTLLAPSEADDPLRAAAAGYIEARALKIGIPLTKKLVSVENMLYEVYSAEQFDAALLGWRLGFYPGYLCEWFGAQGQFDYNGGGVRSACDALDVQSDYEAARQSVYQIESILQAELPFIPLFETVAYDAYRNMDYPFDALLNGVSDFYGVPSHAFPSP